MKCDSTRDWGEIGRRLGEGLVGDWWEIGGRLVGDWWEICGRFVGDLWEIGGRLGGDWWKRWHVLHFFFVFFGARPTFREQLATWLVPRQESHGSNVRVIFVFSLTLEAVSLTFEPYLKIQKKADFQSDTRTFFKN